MAELGSAIGATVRKFTSVNPVVSFQLVLLSELSAAVRALEGFLARVCPHVVLELLQGVELTVAVDAGVLADVQVREHLVAPPGRLAGELGAAVSAQEDRGVARLVLGQLVASQESVLALAALVRALALVERLCVVVQGRLSGQHQRT